MYDRGASFLRVIMSSSLALFCLQSVKKHKYEFFLFLSMYNKTIIRIKVSVRVISLSLRLRLTTPTSTLLILASITKTSSNNCLLSSPREGRIYGLVFPSLAFTSAFPKSIQTVNIMIKIRVFFFLSGTFSTILNPN